MRMILEGHIKNGVVVFDDPVSLPEGTPVRVEVVANGQPQTETPSPATLQKRLENFLKHAVDLPEDAALNVDHYLYGHPKK
jgi:hypothetical protein